jgi:hypothetical protein
MVRYGGNRQHEELPGVGLVEPVDWGSSASRPFVSSASTPREPSWRQRVSAEAACSGVAVGANKTDPEDGRNWPPAL